MSYLYISMLLLTIMELRKFFQRSDDEKVVCLYAVKVNVSFTGIS